MVRMTREEVTNVYIELCMLGDVAFHERSPHDAHFSDVVCGIRESSKEQSNICNRSSCYDLWYLQISFNHFFV